MNYETKWRYLLHSLLILTVCVMWTAGCGGSGDTGSPYWGGGGAQAYSMSGSLYDVISDAPIQGVTCTLEQTKGGSLLKDLLGIPKETVTVSTVTTSQSGLYQFTGLAAGTYSVRFSKTDYVPAELEEIAVYANVTNPDCEMLQISQWNQLAGADHPYSSEKYCAIITAVPAVRGTGLAGVTASITPSDGVQIGYLTDANPETIDWNAASTYSSGEMFVYNLTPGVTYTVSFSIAGSTILPLTFSNDEAGTIYCYQVTPISQTPSPSPTSSSSPTPSPFPSPSPTQTGGGSSPTPSITGLTPRGGVEGTSVTIRGSNFGASQGTNGKIEFNGVQAAAGITWGDIQITADVPIGATTGKIKITTDSQLTATSADSFTIWATTDSPLASWAGSTAESLFGTAVSLSDDGKTALVGATFANSNKGAAYIYVKNDSGWEQKAALTFKDGAVNDFFGSSLTLSGDGSTALVGAQGVSSQKGAAYVYVKAGSGWASTDRPDAALSISGGAAFDVFGYSVSLSYDGSTALIGAPTASSKGVVYIFTKGTSGWASADTAGAILTNGAGASDDYFGRSVSMSNDGSTALIGADNVTVGGHAAQGAAYIYLRGGSGWASTDAPKATLTNGGGTDLDYFGFSVSLSGDASTALVGAHGASSQKGAAYIFAKGGEWASSSTPQASLTNGADGGSLGYAVSMSDDGSLALIGAYKALSSTGAAYVFAKGGAWADSGTPAAKLTKSGGSAGSNFGKSVSISGDCSTALVGAEKAGTGGEAFIYQ